MGYSFELRDVPAQPALYTAVTCKHDEIGATLMQALPATFQYAREHGGTPAGPPFTRYIEMRGDEFDLEAGLPIVERIEASDQFQVGQIGGCQVVFTIHKGPYSKLGDAFEAACAWMAENGKESAGAPWESYIDDPTCVAPEELRTEIYLPVK